MRTKDCGVVVKKGVTCIGRQKRQNMMMAMSQFTGQTKETCRHAQMHTNKGTFIKKKKGQARARANTHRPTFDVPISRRTHILTSNGPKCKIVTFGEGDKNSVLVVTELV